MKILIATSNKGKIAEFKEWFSQEPIEFCLLSQLESPYPGDVEETGSTFEENANIKSLAYSTHSKLPTLSDDSGLCVEALEGAPGLRSARFAGEHATEEENNNYLMQLMLDKVDRRATYVCVLSLYLPFATVTEPLRLIASKHGLSVEDHLEGSVFILSKGEVEGLILSEPLGNLGFAYDPYFFNIKSSKTFGEETNEEKKKYHHRSIALGKMQKFLKEYMRTFDEMETSQ